MARLFCRAMAVIPRKDIKSIRTADAVVTIFPINQKTDTKQTADVKPAASASPRALTDNEIRNVVCRLKDRFPHLKLIVLSIHDEPIAYCSQGGDGRRSRGLCAQTVCGD